MFRATSEKLEDVKVTSTDDLVEFTIDCIDSVSTVEGYRLATALQPGDMLKTMSFETKSNELLQVVSVITKRGKTTVECTNKFDLSYSVL